jgi:hypothetical protein
MMGMGYIHLSHTESKVLLSIDIEFWIFVGLSIFLLFVTLLCYWWWIRRNQRADESLMQSDIEM